MQMGQPEDKHKTPANNAKPTRTADMPGRRLETGSRIGHFRVERVRHGFFSKCRRRLYP